MVIVCLLCYTGKKVCVGKEKKSMEEIKISVRNLVEFILRSGDIDNRQGAMPDQEAMQLGSRLHRKIQGRMGSDYTPEVMLRHRVEYETYAIVIEGRADGIQVNSQGTLIDEIKGVYRELKLIQEPVYVHLAQAKCYAYIYALQRELSSIRVQMTYCNLETEEIKRFEQEYQFRDLREWFEKLIEEFRKWCAFQIRWRDIRRESICCVEFPFPYREGQKELASSVYRTIYHKKKLFIQAPTGVGKTISTVFPAVKAVGEGLGDKIFYLTAKTITRTVAEEAFSVLKKQGLQYKVVTLTAKEKICPLEETSCNPDQCPYAKGHFDRVNDAVYEMVTEGEDFSRDALLAQSEKWCVCPFELSLDVSTWVDAVICDYNYVFDPRAHLKRFFGENVKGSYLFLIDEAHNLVERGREMFSAALVKEDLLDVRKAVKAYSPKLARLLDKCNKKMLEWKRECPEYELHDNIGDFVITLMNLACETENFLEEAQQGEVREKVLELYFELRAFLDTYDRLDEHYVIYTELTESGRFMVKLFCVDPSANIQTCLDKGVSAVLFSATLLPIRYYMSLLSTKGDDYAVYAKSPFDPKRKLLLVGTDVSSRYTRRGEQEYLRIAEYLEKTVKQKTGNYLAFFPSYRMMEDVAQAFERIAPQGVRLLRQSSGMGEQEREAFLESFSSKSQESLLGFCVMGGIFGEGIDLKHDRLIGAVIVGTGLPQICNEREILRNYYDHRGGNGFAYAYLYPGMNKVLQSAGRVIRTDRDRGVILLLDDRFAGRQYIELFPREWADYQVCNRQNVADMLAEFWEREACSENERSFFLQETPQGVKI